VEETASSIDTAQYMYSIQNDTRQLDDNFESVRRKINDVRIQMANAGKERTQEEDEVIKEDVAALRGGLDRSEVSLSTLNILGDKLPSKNASRKKLEELKKSINTLRKKLDHIEALIQPDANTPADLNHLQIGLVDSTTARKEEFALAAPCNQLAADRRDLTDAIVKDAETLKSRNELYATIARRCSWVLYSIGSLLGILAGKPLGE
jgi:small-conductance mechanosensitive channel